MAKKKKPKLTKEEKAARKALKKQRAEEKKRQQRIENLAREQRMAEASWHELKRYFTHMITKMQLPAVRQAMETTWRSYDSTFDHKAHVIECLMRDLNENEEMRQRGVATHAAALDSLIALMEERSNEAYETYKATRTKMLQAAQRVRERMQESGVATRVNFSLVRGAMSARADVAETETQGDYLTRLDDERDKLNDARKLLKGVMERQLDNSWRNLRATLAQYESSATERREKLAEQAQRDARAAALLQRQEVHVQNLEAAEQHMRYRLNHEHPANVLRSTFAEMRYFSAAYCALKERLNKDLELDRRQLTDLVARSNHTLQILRRLVTKAERILTIAKISTRYETFEEHAVPPDVFMELAQPATPAIQPPPESTKEGFSAAVSPRELPLLYAYGSCYHLKEVEKPGEDETSSEASSSLAGISMHNFWRRVARADVRRGDLLLQRNALRMERDSLKRALRCCLQVDEDVCPPVPADKCALPCTDECAPIERRRTICPADKRPTFEASHFYKNMLKW